MSPRSAPRARRPGVHAREACSELTRASGLACESVGLVAPVGLLSQQIGTLEPDRPATGEASPTRGWRPSAPQASEEPWQHEAVRALNRVPFPALARDPAAGLARARLAKGKAILMGTSISPVRPASCTSMLLTAPQAAATGNPTHLSVLQTVSGPLCESSPGFRGRVTGRETQTKGTAGGT